MAIDHAKMVLLQVTSQPHSRVRALAELSNHLVLAIIEHVAEQNGVVATWAVVLHPLAK